MKVTLTLSDELATQLQSLSEDEIPRVLELGLRRRNGVTCDEFDGLSDLLEALVNLPTPDEIIALKPSATLQQRIDDMLEKNRTVGLTPDEEQWWNQYEYVEHLVRIAKAKAALKLKEV